MFWLGVLTGVLCTIGFVVLLLKAVASGFADTVADFIARLLGL